MEKRAKASGEAQGLPVWQIAYLHPALSDPQARPGLRILISSRTIDSAINAGFYG